MFTGKLKDSIDKLEELSNNLNSLPTMAMYVFPTESELSVLLNIQQPPETRKEGNNLSGTANESS